MSQRILFTIDDLFELGPAGLLRPLIDALQQDGHRVRVAALNPDPDALRAWQDQGLEVLPLQKPGPGASWRSVWARHRRLLEELAGYQPTIVHSWDRRARQQTSWAVGGLDRAQRSRLRHWHSQLSVADEAAGGQRPRWLGGQGIETTIVPVEPPPGRKNRRGPVIPSGVRSESPGTDLRTDVRSRLGLKPTDYLAVAVAPLEPASRLKDLIWATDLLVCIRDDVHLAILGQGTQHDRLRRFAGLTEAGQHVHLLGHPEDALQILQAADVYWHAHLRQPLPIPLLQAMAAGVPAIGVLGPGLEPLIEHQVTGLAVNFGARDEFARWTKYLLEQPDSARQLGQQGQDRVRQRFSQVEMLEAYRQLYAGSRASGTNAA